HSRHFFYLHHPPTTELFTLSLHDALPILINPFDLKNYSLIFTSVNGVASFFKNRFKPNEDFTAKNYNKIYCVGEKTKRELRKHGDRKSTRLNSSHVKSSYAVFCLKKKKDT